MSKAGPLTGEEWEVVRRHPLQKEKQVTQDELIYELYSAPGNERTVWAVLYEDVYETVFGDGYYAYFADAFFTREEAERFAATPSAYRFHIRQIQLSLSEGRIYSLPLNLNRSETIDLDALVAALSYDPTPRKPKTQY